MVFKNKPSGKAHSLEKSTAYENKQSKQPPYSSVRDGWMISDGSQFRSLVGFGNASFESKSDFV